MKILAIESSCDETAAAVTEEKNVLSSVVVSQIAEHAIYGGVVPEIASRMHAENIVQVVKKALDDAGTTPEKIDAIAVTYAPGLIGALLVGVNFAKGMALALKKPLIPVHHIRSHIASNYITNPFLEPPFMCLVASGGHSHIIMVNDYTDFKVIGRTVDDAAGECFDKSARTLDLPYPGGVHLDRLAEKGDASLYNLPHPHVSGKYDMSFSGLKTAVINLVHNEKQKNGELKEKMRADIAAAVRYRVCDMLIDSTLRAAKDLGVSRLAVAGGVSANSELRRRLKEECKDAGIDFYLPDLSLCGDNAAMVGVQAYYEYRNGHIAGSDLNAYATMPIEATFNMNE